MRTMLINEKTFYYALYQGNQLVEEDGYYTGERAVTYSEPVAVKANISAARGEAYVDQFGANVEYDKVIVTCKDLPIDENSVLWIDADPSEPYDYIVKKVARSINVTSIAASKVKVS